MTEGPPDPYFTPGLEGCDAASTSAAAAVVARDVKRESLAIGSEMAAEREGLEVLMTGLQDEEGNATRFLVLRHARWLGEEWMGGVTGGSAVERGGRGEDGEEDGGREEVLGER